MTRASLFVAAFLFALCAGPQDHAAQLSSCTTGSTTCSNDTVNDGGVLTATSDGSVQTRIWGTFNAICLNSVYTEAATTVGHVQRVNFCQAIAASPPNVPGSRVPTILLVSSIMNSTTIAEVLSTYTGSPVPGQAASNLVDTDVVSAINTVLTVTSVSASTTATQSTVGANFFTVASATNIVVGQPIYAIGIPNGATVTLVSGTTVYMNQATTAALSSTAVVFGPLLSGLATRNW